MAENKCISRICLVGFDENIIRVILDEEDEKIEKSGEYIENKE